MATSRRMTESRSHTGRHRYGIMSRRPDLSTTMADRTRRHDGLDAAMQARHRDSGPRRVEGSPRLHREGTGGPIAARPRLRPYRAYPEIIRDARGEHRIIASLRGTPDLAPGREFRAEGLHEVVGRPLGLPSVSSRFANVTSSHHRGDSSSSIRRRSTDDERGDSAYGSRGGGERTRPGIGSGREGGGGGDGRSPASRRRERSATPRRADRARAGGDLGVPARVLRGDRREEGAEQGGCGAITDSAATAATT